MLKNWFLMFLIKKVCASLRNLAILFKVRIKTKKMHHVLEFNQSQWLKAYVEFNTQKRIEAEKNGDKDREALCKLMRNAICGKTM